MRTEKKFMRRRYAPLVTGCTLACTTPESTPTQIFNGSEYQPNREGTAGVPCAICPVVSASASDGTWPDVRSNNRLSTMQWYVNGAKIDTLSDWTGKYSVGTDGDTKGQLLIKRNTGLNERIRLRFEATLLDSRTGDLIPVRSEETTLYTTEAAEDAWTVETDYPQNLIYSPVDDNLLLAEYRTAQGKATGLAAAEQYNGNEYLRTAAIRVRKGMDLQTSGYSVKLYRTDSGSEVEVTTASPELVALTATSMTLDLRLIDSGATFLLKVVCDGKVVAVKTVGTVCRIARAISVKPMVEGDIYPDTVTMFQRAKVNYQSSTLADPDAVLRLKLLGSTAYETDVELGEGCDVSYRLDSMTVGNTDSDNYVTTCYDYEYKPVYCMATDESGNQFTDENGNPYIFN